MAAALPVTGVFFGCGGGEGAETEERSGRSAQLVAEGANLAGVHSGAAEVTLEIASPAEEEAVRMQSRALFIGLGHEDPPQFDITIQSHGELAGREIGWFGAFLLLDRRAVLYYHGQTFRPRRSTFEIVKSKFQAAQKSGNVGNAMACVEAVEGEKVSELLRDPRLEGHRRDHDGTPVTLIGGELDVGRALGAFIRMTRDPACGAQLKAAGLPTDAQLEAVRTEAVQAVERATVQISVDKRGVMRDLSAEVVAKGPAGDPLEVGFTWLLEDANQLKELPHPAADAGLPLLLRQFDTDLSTVQAATGGHLFLGLLRAISEELTGR